MGTLTKLDDELLTNVAGGVRRTVVNYPPPTNPGICRGGGFGLATSFLSFYAYSELAVRPSPGVPAGCLCG